MVNDLIYGSHRRGKLTEGISLGSSTDLVTVRTPFSMGHSRSTFSICSHRSALVLIRRMRPYLTWRRTYAPFSMFCLTVPEALMTSSLPLKHHVSWLPFHDTAVCIVIDWGCCK